MFRDLERAQKVFTGLAAHVRFGANSPRWADAQRRGPDRFGRLLPGPRPPAGARALFGPQDNRTVGESHVVVLRSRLLADPVRRQSGGPRRKDDRQRPADDHRRRRPARVHGDDARIEARGVRPDRAAGPDAAELQGLGGSPELLGVPCSPVSSPGCRSSRRARPSMYRIEP